jgi:hypothetical protein
MVIDERSRHTPHQRLEELLGPESAATLMEHLPPVGWADVATKHDLDHLEETLWQRFQAETHLLRAEFHRDIAALQWRIVTWVTGLNVGLAGLVFAAAKLA